jgi:hypothetical protein
VQPALRACRYYLKLKCIRLDYVDVRLTLLGKLLSIDPLSVEHYVSVLHR